MLSHASLSKVWGGGSIINNQLSSKPKSN
jgi:hypothetical protein